MLSVNEIKMVRSLSEKKFRDRSGLFIAEGTKLVDEAVKSGFTVEKIYRREEIGEKAMSRISSLASPPPVLATVHKPEKINVAEDSVMTTIMGKSGLFLALDSIRDPGNLGTILRIADWFGVNAVFASSDTVDVFNPKVVQATMGAIFRVDFHYADIPSVCRAAVNAGGSVYGTFLNGESIYEIDNLNDGKCSPSVIVTGNEADGISGRVAEAVTDRILIPSYPAGMSGMESLNAAVATALTVAEFRRRSK